MCNPTVLTFIEKICTVRSYIIFFLSFFLFFFAALRTDSESWLPLSEGRGTSRSHSFDAPHSLELLWTSDRPEAETCTWQHKHSQERDIHFSDEVRTHSPSKWVAAEPRLSPRGHWEQRTFHVTYKYIMLFKISLTFLSAHVIASGSFTSGWTSSAHAMQNKGYPSMAAKGQIISIAWWPWLSGQS